MRNLAAASYEILLRRADIDRVVLNEDGNRTRTRPLLFRRPDSAVGVGTTAINCLLPPPE